MEKSITAAELADLLAASQPLTLLDVRRKGDFDASPALVAGALWLDPTEVEQWLPTITAERKVIVYCARGGSVSQTVQHVLSENGLRALYVEGGLAAIDLQGLRRRCGRQRRPG